MNNYTCAFTVKILLLYVRKHPHLLYVKVEMFAASCGDKLSPTQFWFSSLYFFPFIDFLEPYPNRNYYLPSRNFNLNLPLPRRGNLYDIYRYHDLRLYTIRESETVLLGLILAFTHLIKNLIVLLFLNTNIVTTEILGQEYPDLRLNPSIYKVLLRTF